MRRIKVLGTAAVISGKYLRKLHEMGVPAHKNQFRVICGCISIADANRQCEAAGLNNRTFKSGYTSETGNDKELELAGNGGLFVEIAYDRYVSVEELQEIKEMSQECAQRYRWITRH